MAGAKTEQPTPKRLREARKKGQVFRSNDLTQAILFLAAAGVLAWGGPPFVEQLRQLMRNFFQPAVMTGRLGQQAALDYLGYAWGRLLLLSAPFLAAVFVVSAGVNFLQVRALFAVEAVKPQMKRINPVEGFKNIFFKVRTYIELGKNVVKLVVVLAIAYLTIKNALTDLAMSVRLDINQAGALAGSLVSGLLFKCGIAFLIIGAADYLIQKKLYLKEMMMSKEEVKREFKEEEGDPNIKQARHRLHQAVLAQSSIQEVRRADVVVVNPTHLAVAVKYEERVMNAPRVTAKGQNKQAERILEEARRHRIPVMRNIPLAHGLFEVEVGREIPEDLYEAVAEVLNWVYQLAQTVE